MAVTVLPDLVTTVQARVFAHGRATIRKSGGRIGERGSSLSALFVAGATAALIGTAPVLAQQLAPGTVPTAPPKPGKLVYSPWTRFCTTPPQTSGVPPICFTGREMMTDAGEPIAAAALIEPAGSPNRIFRVTVPAPLQLRYGTRIIIDRGEPFTAPYFTCSGDSCISDYDAGTDFVAKLKTGQTLEIQAVELNEKPISFDFSLSDFAKAAEGPPTDARAMAEDPKNLAGGTKK
jgi:invasion protein IalB